MKRAHLAAAALLAAACSTGPTVVGLRLSEPSAIVAYRGIANGNGQVRPLLALASRHGDELRLVDPSTNLPIFGPGVIFPLSILTEPQPQLLASASLNDGGADLLVSVSAGSTTLQVIETWTETGRVALEVKLDDQTPPVLAKGAQILSVLGIPATRDVNNKVLVNARVLVATTGGQLVVVEFQRDGDALKQLGTAVPKPIGFDAIDMALLLAPDESPNERRVFLASRYAVGTTAGGTPIFGVGELDGASDLSLPLVIAPLDARAPTVAVAAGRVFERKVDKTSDPCSPFIFAAPPIPPLPSIPPLVYAALDESGCGPDQRISCGIATLDPATGQLAVDLGGLATPAEASPDGVSVPAQDYRTPMPVVGVPMHIAIGFPPASGTHRYTNQVIPGGCVSSAAGSNTTPLLRMQPATGLIDTGAVAMVSSSDGRVYWYDLSRSAPVNDVSAVAGAARTGVTSASTATPGGIAPAAGTWALGLWNDVSGTVPTASVTADPALLPLFIETWPGFTGSATWRLVWQGGLPLLTLRAGVIANVGGLTFAAFQTQATSGTWNVVAPVADPALGVHEGDTLEFLGCQATVFKILPATDPLLAGPVPFAGGALQLQEKDPNAPCLPVSMTFTTLTVRASGLVLSNDRAGYMGRPQLALQPVAAGSTDGPFTLGWQDESTLQGEALALARKARRIFYPINPPCPVPGALAGSLGALPVGCYDGYPRVKDPLSPGPALRLRPGLTFIGAPGVTPGPAVIPPDTALTFVTTDGLLVTSRRPAIGGALPANVAVVDPNQFIPTKDEDVRFYVPYADDQLAEFTAANSATQVTSLR